MDCMWYFLKPIGYTKKIEKKVAQRVMNMKEQLENETELFKKI